MYQNVAKLHHAFACMTIPRYRGIPADNMTTLSRFSRHTKGHSVLATSCKLYK